MIEGISNMKEKLETYFGREKNFTNKELTIDQSCKEMDCSKKELTDYLKLYEQTTFAAYLNQLRISEFKRLLEEKENAIYDINSIAEMAGFKSRATFYRVFKELEGMTPTAYKKTLKA